MSRVASGVYEVVGVYVHEYCRTIGEVIRNISQADRTCDYCIVYLTTGQEPVYIGGLHNDGDKLRLHGAGLDEGMTATLLQDGDTMKLFVD